MVFIRKKKIHGKERYYLEKSVRQRGGTVKKYSLYLSQYTPSAKIDTASYEKQLEKKIQKDVASSAARYYTKNNIFTEESIKRFEEIAFEYKQITKKLTLKQWSDIIDRFTVNFTYESNAIEGNSLTLKDVTFVLHEGKAIKGKDLREVYEVLNTRTAFEMIFNKKFVITEENIIKLHSILVKDTGVTMGYKRLPNFLLGRKTKTTVPEQVALEMKKLIDWCNFHKNIHPLQLAAEFHGRFEKIHPFEDGNGRVGRLLINSMLINKGYPPLIIRKTQRISYFSALEAFDNGSPTKIFWFLIERYKETYEKFFKIYVKYLQ